MTVCAAMALLCVLCGVAALGFGAVSIDIETALSALFSGSDELTNTIVQHIRAPRIVLALLAGAALGIAGAALQGVFRNPLADPGLIGVSSGAALAASAVIVLFSSAIPAIWQPFVLPVAGFAGGIVVTLLILKISALDGYTNVATLLLAGVAVNALCGAGIGLLTYVADDFALRSLTFWMFGSLAKAGWQTLIPASAFLLIPCLLLPRYGRSLDVMLLGEQEAQASGVDTEKLKIKVIFLSVICVAAAVALCGVIGFIGLIVPHGIRLIFGPKHTLLLPASAFGGALVLLAADTFARSFAPPLDMPIGVITASFGAPVFVYLLLKMRRHVEAW